MSRRYIAHAAGLVLLMAAQQACAEFVCCSFTGMHQGVIQGDRGLGGDATLIPVRALTEEVSTPIDAASGLPTGKRQHKPLTLLKSLDRASPLLFEAAVTNETMKTVKCNFYRTHADGRKTTAYFSITLTNALIADLRIAGDGAIDGGERESVSLTYQKIEMMDLDSNTDAIDDWSTAF